MRQTFDEYYLKVREKAEQVALEQELRDRVNPHGNSNSGHSAQSLEDARLGFWRRMLWLLVGAALVAGLVAGFFALSARG